MSRILSLVRWAIYLIAFCSHLSPSVMGQSSSVVLSPNDEVFENADSLVVPWRSSGCKYSNPTVRDKNCYIVTTAEFTSRDFVALYNADGTTWFSFSLSPQSAFYFLLKAKDDFRPFALYPLSAPDTVILRMVGESKNWFRVEVNEESRNTKYVPKDDGTWAKDSWSAWLLEGFTLQVNVSKSKFHDRPEGKVIFDGSDLADARVSIHKIEGDWAYVRGNFAGPSKMGWIRWRRGRELLVGCIFNGFKTP